MSIRTIFLALTMSVSAGTASYAVDYKQSIECAGFMELAMTMQPDAGNAPELKRAWMDYAKSLSPDANVAKDTSAHAAKMQTDLMSMRGDPAQMGPYMKSYQEVCPNPLKPVQRVDPSLCLVVAERASMTVTLAVLADGDPMLRGVVTDKDRANLATSREVRFFSEPVEEKYKDAKVDFDDLTEAERLIPDETVPEEAIQFLKDCLAR